MVGQNLRSRSNRRRKKRKNNRNLMIVLALAFLFFTIVLALIVLNKNDDSEVQQKDHNEEQQVSESENEKGTSDNKTDSTESTEEKDDSSNEIEEEEEEESSVSIREIEPEEIDGSNVVKAYEGDWKPIGTNQSGPHTTNYQNGSQDRIEIKKAVSTVTDVAEENMVEWRVENGGDQKVIATVSDDQETEYFRVYLTWVDNKGWQVTKIEHLKENDKK